MPTELATTADPSIPSPSIRKDLKKKRASIKCRLTLFRKYVNSFEGIKLTDVQLKQLKLRVVGSQTLLNEFNYVQTQIEDLCLESEIGIELESREEFERDFYDVLAVAECLTVPDEGSVGTNGAIDKRANGIEMPTISIPCFDGSYEHWLEFRDTFLSLVHNCKTITQIQKYHYLKSSLKDSAKEVIESLEFTADNYEVAWELLVDRFDNTKFLVHNHVKSIFTIPRLTKESPVHLRKLIDTVLRNLRALKLLGQPTEHWDTLIIYLIGTKLDPTSELEWEQYKRVTLKTDNNSKISILLKDLIEFLKGRADMLQTLQASHNITKSSNSKSSNPNKGYNQGTSSKVHCNVGSTQNNKPRRKNARSYKPCCLCNELHPLYSCQRFLDLDTQGRCAVVKDKQLCINCLRSGHTVDTCVFGACRKCNQKHNSLICEVIDSNVNKSTVTHVDNTHVSTLQAQSIHNSGDTNVSHSAKPVLLSTAIVEVRSESGAYHQARAVLDSGSERSFITQSFIEKLNTQVIQSTQKILGVGSLMTQSTKFCTISLKSRISSFTARLQCLILPKITSNLPISSLRAHYSIPDNVVLADPFFYNSQPIDLLIGADLFWELIQDGRMRLKSGPFLQNTHLGWIVSGTLHSITHKGMKNISCHFTQSNDDDDDDCLLNQTLRKFWELEELPNPLGAGCSDEERACEEYFTQTTTRDDDGRFTVRFPFKHSPKLLGDTRVQAERRFFALEKRLQRNPSYMALYRDFIHEYVNLGHMSLVHNNSYSATHYFLPHHGVLREHSTTTKLRVVFDASMSSSSGISLNDLQMIGSAMQGDLIAILLRFRENRYVACADIEKMYRQVLIADDERDYQLILWRDNPSEPLRVYRLNRVTYGISSSPFLSCRCLKYLAQDSEVPHVKDNINDNFFVDDLIIGSNDVSSLNQICEDIDSVLKSACFNLRKWIFNYDHANPNNTNDVVKGFLPNDETQNKTLGIGWNNRSDELLYYSKINNLDAILTKRIILSSASQIFDPLGLISPAITIAKTLLQKCWLLKLEWDEPVPREIAQIWERFVESLSSLSCLRIPRHAMCNNPTCIELHIFTDASQTAYGACAYLRTISSCSLVSMHLLCSKGKVAPTKPTTIPRLELCGALLGARLFTKIQESLRSKLNKIVFWTDSTIVLGWLGMPTNLLKPFVQNRTAEIHSLTQEWPWRHVPGKQNPADIVSRGLYIDALGTSQLWWNGPQFLHDSNFDLYKLSNSIYQTEDLPELRPTTAVCNISSMSDNNALYPFLRFSNYLRLKRTAAYVLRFIYNTRNKTNRHTGSLSLNELDISELALARLSQQESYPELYSSFIHNKKIKCNSQLARLNLFLDANKLIRVGGRIQYATDFSYDKRYPILINSKHHFALLLFRHEHNRLLHAAPQLLLFTLRESWWPVGGRDLAKRVVHRCMKCARFRATTPNPIMGNLPRERLIPGFPFLRCGVDYAGPVFILNRKGRGARLQKAYICLFICFASRAIHLELVTDLSSDAYILALKRFVSRRGKPSEIFSDNGRNFVGAMNDFAQFLKGCSDTIIDYATSQNINFKMIPAYASHFAGYWESGIKSCKHHLRRVVGNAHLTFEELSTALTQIEAVLNSRPLSPMSTDPADFLPLTPAHFLIGRPLTAPVSADLQELPASRLTRYQRVEQIRQHFWSRWAKEYVSELQVRSKWYHNKGDLKEDTLVLLKDDNLPPLRWSLGRVVKTYPGKDNVSRVADIRKSDGVVRRAFSKVCPLPVDEE